MSPSVFGSDLSVTQNWRSAAKVVVEFALEASVGNWIRLTAVSCFVSSGQVTSSLVLKQNADRRRRCDVAAVVSEFTCIRVYSEGG
jgi:hypothetical protein